jgi:selenide,water dikinase
VVAGPGGDAGVLRHGEGVQVVTTDALRAFTEDPYLLGRTAVVHALGDVWATGAEPQAAVLTVTLPRMTPRLQERTLREVVQAASDALGAAGAALIGGHTSIGEELSVGLTVTGLTVRPVGQDGARPGDALLLTRPIGTGTVLAAEMRGLARGADVAAVWERIVRPQGEAAAILAEHATAMTDVTGFGLANHLLGICEASGVGARIDLDAVPLVRGVLALAERGVRSSLFADNAAAAGGAGPDGTDPRAALLYDPQTAGGLLATVPQTEVNAVLAALPEAHVIGTVTLGEGVKLRS